MFRLGKFITATLCNLSMLYVCYTSTWIFVWGEVLQISLAKELKNNCNLCNGEQRADLEWHEVSGLTSKFCAGFFSKLNRVCLVRLKEVGGHVTFPTPCYVLESSMFSRDCRVSQDSVCSLLKPGKSWAHQIRSGRDPRSASF